MRLDFAKYTPMDSCDNVRSENRGSYNVWTVTNSINEPKGSRKISSKISQVLVQSFLKRPSFKEVAFENISKLANDAVMSSQTPNFRVQCEMLMLILKGKQVKWVRNGNVKLYHFADGEFISGTDPEPSAPLGEELGLEPEIYETEVLDKRDHYFVALAGDCDDTLSVKNVEHCLGKAETAQELMSDLLHLHSANGGGENISVFTLHLPPKKKKLIWLLLIPVILIILFFVVGALGRMRPGM